MKSQIDKVENKLNLNNKPFTVEADEHRYLIKVAIKGSSVTNDIGFSRATGKWFHNKNTNENTMTSRWNYSREDNNDGIGWYSFLVEEILERLDEII